uniref:CCHC-type domain-containing protein n=1 Tax=Fagus sylvatica TaxID=28930 RepID=A0A2N9GSY4_FAGSY
MNEGGVVGDHVNQLELIAKELVDAGHTLSEKMQVTIVLNSLPPSWDHPKYKFKHKRFKKQWTRKPRQEYKPQDICYRCGEKGHYKNNCPLNKRPKNKGKEIAMTITEALVIESPPTSWWVDSAATRHIARNHELFVDLKEKQLGEHRVYMGNNTYSDVLGEDDYSKYGYIYLLKYKSEAVEKFKEFKLEVENQLGRSIKSLKNDMGGEYEAFDQFCKEMGIRHIYTMPYKPQQNGIAERRNRTRTLMDMMRSIMAYADLQIVFWGKTLSTVAYILNRVKTKSKPLTPFEIWTGHQPDMTNLKVWGCKTHVLIPKPLQNKLTNKTWECKFIGYVENGSGYRFFHSDKRLIESRDVVFMEDTKLITPLEQIKKLLHAESKKSDPHVSVFSDKDLENSGRKRQKRPSSILRDYYLMESKVVAIEDDPANFAKAMESRKPVGCKWVLRKKYKADGSLDKYKARDLKEEIYMDQPDGFQIKGQEGKVCRLKKSLYGLKQSSRQWYLKFHQAILDIGYEMSPLDHCVYVWRDKEKLALLLFYVDDILLARIRISRDRDSKLIYLDQENYLEKVLKRFKMEDCRPVSTPVSKGTILNKSKAHWQTVKQIFRYLQMTKSMKLCFGLDELEIKGFTDADFAGDTDDRKSTSGYVFLFGGIAVSWLSKKQGCVV